MSEKIIVISAPPKIITEDSLQRKCFEAINFVKITKQSLYKTNSLACFLAKRDTPVAATLQRKYFGGIIFVIISKKITKIIVARNCFVIFFLGQDGTVWRWNGSSGSGFRFRRFLCKRVFFFLYFSTV